MNVFIDRPTDVPPLSEALFMGKPVLEAVENDEEEEENLDFQDTLKREKVKEIDLIPLNLLCLLSSWQPTFAII